MSYIQDYANNASRILEHKGEALGTAKANQAATWGNTIANLGQVIPQQVQQVLKQRAEQKKTQQIQSIIQQNGGDLEKSIPLIMGVDATIGAHLADEHAKVQKSVAEAKSLDIKAQSEKLDYSERLLNDVSDEQSYARWALVQHSLGDSVPDHYDPGYVQQRKDALIAQKKALEAGKPHFKGMPGGGVFNEVTGEVTTPPAPKNEKPKTWAEIALDKEDPNSPTQNQSAAAWETHQKVEKVKDLNPASVEYYVRSKYGDTPTPEQVLQAHEAFAKSTSHGTAAGDIPVRIEKFDPQTGQTIVSYVPRSQAVGQTFEKPPSATLGNRLASAKAVVQTGNDIAAQVKDPKVAAMLGPAMGRYNNLREFLGDPPPELSELAGNISSFALAQMGVHGMRNAEMAKQIEDMLGAKHTPEALAARIQGINKFAQHLMENQGMSAGPKVGDIKTFPNGKKGRWDGKGWELVTSGAK